LYPTQDEGQVAAAAAPTSVNATATPADQEQLTREDLKYTVKIFLRFLEPEILEHTIETGWSMA
jgi:hypothetical protein